MGANPLNDKSIRRIARTTGLDVVYAFGWGGYWHLFVTADHRHGYWHRRSHEWEWWVKNPRYSSLGPCSTSCRTRFTEDQPVIPTEDGETRRTCTCAACEAYHARRAASASEAGA